MRNLIVFLLLLTGLAWAANHSVAGNGKTESFALSGQDTVSVAGNQNVVTVTGSGVSISVAGNGNTLNVDAELTSINLVGNGNHVKVKPGHKAPKVNNVGKDNVVD